MSAAAADPNTSPLDFLLGLMRDPNVPAELRVKIAQATVPFVHSKPRDGHPVKGKYGAHPGDINVDRGSDSADRNAEPATKANLSPQGADADLSPLDFLLGVMRDPDAPPHLRIKGAHIAAPFLHPKRDRPGRRTAVLDDPYGFVIDRALARALLQEWWEFDRASRRINFPELDADVEAKAKAKARMAKIAKPLECPSGYGPVEVMKDRERVQELSRKSVLGTKLTTADKDELAQLVTRIAAYDNTPEAVAREQARQRFRELHGKEYDGTELTIAEKSELESLRAMDLRVDVLDENKPPPDVALIKEKNFAAMMRARDEWRAKNQT